MADLISSTPQPSLHTSSPSRKRTRDGTRSSNFVSTSCKTAATTGTSSLEIMETGTIPIILPPTITKPRSSIHSSSKTLSTITHTNGNTNGTNGSTQNGCENGQKVQYYAAVSLFFLKKIKLMFSGKVQIKTSRLLFCF